MTKNFKTQYDKPDRVYSAAGQRYKKDYTAARDEFGRLQLVETGSTDVYAAIQSYRESTDLSVIISRFLNGDASALNRHPSFYGDLVGVPTSLNEALRVIEDAKRNFDTLDAGVRSRFDNDFGVFVSLMDNPVEWSRRFKGEDGSTDFVSDHGGDVVE